MSLEEKIVNIVHNQLNASRALSNLKRNQNVTPAVIKVLQTNSGPKLARIVPSNVLADTIVKMVRNGIIPPPKVTEPLARRILETQSQKTINDISRGILGKNMAREIQYRSKTPQPQYPIIPSKPRNNGFKAPFIRNNGFKAPPFSRNNSFYRNDSNSVSKALEMASEVPGGVPEVAIAAEALNETNGNVKEATEIKGASPEAIKTVQALGGHENAMKILRSIRGKELDRVLESVKKRKLVSLVTRNVTKKRTEMERPKPYYKKVMKSYIKNTPFWKIAKRAAHKKSVA